MSYNKWIMLGKIVSGSRREQRTTRDVPMCKFLIRDGENRTWEAVAFGQSCEYVRDETEDDTSYIFEGRPKQHVDGSSDLDVPEYFMQVLFVRSIT